MELTRAVMAREIERRLEAERANLTGLRMGIRKLFPHGIRENPHFYDRQRKDPVS